MTEVFDRYSNYYDLLYRDKDYTAEADYVDRLLQTHTSGARTILELGCGTGGHAICLARRGYEIYGIDLSSRMLESANRDRQQLPSETSKRLTLAEGDIRSFRCARTFDAVLSLFHVVSYQTSNEDLLATFKTAAVHLRPGGVFVFDFWYGPAVLAIQPSTRIKRIEDDDVSVVRIAEPRHLENENRVDIEYQLFVTDKATQEIKEFRETHRMRYLFLPEISGYLTECGLSPILSEEWLTRAKASLQSWSVCSVSRK